MARLLLQVGLFFLVLQLAIAVAYTSNSIILAALLGPSAVAEYAVVAKLFMIPTVMVGFALGPLWPAYREALSRGDTQWVRRTFRRSLRVSLAVGGVVSAVLVALGLPLIAAWVGPQLSRRSDSSLPSASGPRSVRSGLRSQCFLTELRSCGSR